MFGQILSRARVVVELFATLVWHACIARRSRSLRFDLSMRNREPASGAIVFRSASRGSDFVRPTRRKGIRESSRCDLFHFGTFVGHLTN